MARSPEAEPRAATASHATARRQLPQLTPRTTGSTTKRKDQNLLGPCHRHDSAHAAEKGGPSDRGMTAEPVDQEDEEGDFGQQQNLGQDRPLVDPQAGIPAAMPAATRPARSPVTCRAHSPTSNTVADPMTHARTCWENQLC